MTESDQVLPDLQRWEEAIDNIGRKLPGSPRQEIILARLLAVARDSVGSYFDAGLKPAGLNHTVWMALLLIYSRPEQRVSPSCLASALNFSRTNATRVVDELVERGWVSRQSCFDDRRKTELELTDAGVALIAGLIPDQRQRMRALWEDFSADERDTLERLLRKLLTRLDG